MPLRVKLYLTYSIYSIFIPLPPQAKLCPRYSTFTWLPLQAKLQPLNQVVIHIFPIYTTFSPSQVATLKPSCYLNGLYSYHYPFKSSRDPQAKLSPTWSICTPLPLQAKPRPSSHVVTYMVHMYIATPPSQAMTLKQCCYLNGLHVHRYLSKPSRDPQAMLSPSWST